VSSIARALGVSRPHLSSSRRQVSAPRKPRTRRDDEETLARIRSVTDEKATYGYRRVAGRLRARGDGPPVNHKRCYRLMKQHGLLLPRYTGKKGRVHDGKVVTLRSDLRWCSDTFEIRCWNGERVYVGFSLDCCDREAIGYVASSGHLIGEHIRDLMAMTIEARFGTWTTKVPHPIEWLSDNGPPYTAHETRAFGAASGLRVCTTPAYSPESNGMAEAFVKTFKRDYVYLAELHDAESVLRQLPAWFEDYNEVHPHKGLKMLSPRQFRRAQAAA
jgi:putative transposase